ncbi:unnamed protein product [Parnassius apollo]|uniref:(apollo) hypothetical protein n=1 Tax=Parnassius apollo TaxID=110799 RepID=A0A8S3Y284_PARAO|nr:unnamed protein product [Parnassius apollo]
MWWRFLAFCVLVSLVLFVVLSSIYGRPVVHLFFHRCCEEDIENDQVIFENFGNNFLRERLVATDVIEMENVTLFPMENIEQVLDGMRKLINVHDPETRESLDDIVDVLITDNSTEVTLETTTQVMKKQI